MTIKHLDRNSSGTLKPTECSELKKDTDKFKTKLTLPILY